MRAILLENFGAAESLNVREVPTPAPGNGEVLVEIRAAAINPSDVKNVEGKMHGTALPRVPGRDFAGVIVQGAREYVGREVWGTGGDLGFTRDGSHAQYMLLPTNAVIAKPAALSFEEAGSGGVTFLTAWLAMVEAANIARGETALIIGASGGVGSAAVQIAKSRGARVIGAIRKDQEAQLVRELGAEQTINTKTEDLPQAIGKLTDGRGADVVFDSSGMMFAEAIESAANGARVPVISAPADGKATFNLRSLYRKQLVVKGVDSRALDATACAAILDRMKPMFESREFKVKTSERWPLERAAEAYGQASHGARIVLVPR